MTPATSAPSASWARTASTVAECVGVVEAPVVGVEHDAGGLAALAREAIGQDVGGVLGLDARHPLAVLELAAHAALQRRRRRWRPPARGPAPETGDGRCCGRGGTGMRSRGPPGSGPAPCGTPAPSRRVLTWGRAAAEPPGSGAGRPLCRPLPALEGRRERGPRAAVAASWARSASSCWKAGTSAPASARRRAASPRRTAASSGSSPSAAMAARTVQQTAAAVRMAASWSTRFRNRRGPPAQ